MQWHICSSRCPDGGKRNNAGLTNIDFFFFFFYSSRQHGHLKAEQNSTNLHSLKSFDQNEISIFYSEGTRAINVSSEWGDKRRPSYITLSTDLEKMGQGAKWHLTNQNKPQASFPFHFIIIWFALNVKKQGGCVKIFKIRTQKPKMNFSKFGIQSEAWLTSRPSNTSDEPQLPSSGPLMEHQTDAFSSPSPQFTCTLMFFCLLFFFLK